MEPRRVRNPRGEGARLRGELVAAADALLRDVASEDDLSMRAVARQAGVAPQSVYLHFADKHELLSAVYEVRFGELVHVLRDAVEAAGGEPHRRLAAFCSAYVRYAENEPGHYRVLFGTGGTPGWEPEDMVGMAAWALLRDILSAMEVGAPDIAATWLWASMHGVVTLRRDRPSFPWPPMDDLLDQLLTVVALAGSRGA